MKLINYCCFLIVICLNWEIIKQKFLLDFFGGCIIYIVYYTLYNEALSVFRTSDSFFVRLQEKFPRILVQKTLFNNTNRRIINHDSIFFEISEAFFRFPFFISKYSNFTQHNIKYLKRFSQTNHKSESTHLSTGCTTGLFD